jgi:hypothetical protein
MFNIETASLEALGRLCAIATQPTDLWRLDKPVVAKAIWQLWRGGRKA